MTFLRSIKFRFALLSALCCGLIALPASASPALTPELQLSKLPTAHVDRDESPESIARRRAVLADAVRGYSVRERALLLAVGFGESRFAEYVLHDCNWRPPRSVGNCDKGKARSYWQLHQATCPVLWTLPSGSDAAVHAAAECAIRQLRYGMARCKTIEGALAVYAGAFMRVHPTESPRQSAMGASIGGVVMQLLIDLLGILSVLAGIVAAIGYAVVSVWRAT